MLLRKQPGILKKMTLINSDLTQDEILSEEDRRMLVKEVDIVFHCAATVRFDEKLRQAVNINVKSTKYLLDMAREMSNLKVTTADHIKPLLRVSHFFTTNISLIIY